MILSFPSPSVYSVPLKEEISHFREDFCRYAPLASREYLPQITQMYADIVDPKVVTAFTETHIAQMTGLSLAILLNFKEARLQWQRVVRTGAVDGPAEGS
ncbi:hypothetical protein SBV1_220026 [Verrucomicrobia bacterium]|nr:hypothetical protein SBV1_220026 [Verrucomicrobiota bacterium]